MNINIQDLYQKPYISIPFSIEKTQIAKAIHSFTDFLDLPDTIKNHIDFKISPLHRRGDIGFKHRDAQDDIYNDSKDFFHYHPLIEKHYLDFIDSNKTVKEFLQQASLIWEKVYSTVRHILSHFEKNYPGTLAKVFDTDTPHILLRFLRYEYPHSGMNLEKPHFDAGSFTLAIAESKPGLRIGTHPDDLELVTYQENSAIFMISRNFKKIVNDSRLKPAWHDVIQTDESSLGQAFSRLAIIAFIDGYNVKSLERNETHKFYTPYG